jgi:hypothetical protein
MASVLPAMSNAISVRSAAHYCVERYLYQKELGTHIFSFRFVASKKNLCFCTGYALPA